MATYSGIQVFGGDIVSADDLNANVPTVYTKENVETRISTTTLADDGELKNIPLQVGVYEIELFMCFTQGSTTPKIQTQWKFTGTWNSPIRICMGPGQPNVAGPNNSTEMYSVGVPTDTASAVYSRDAGTLYAAVRESCRYVIVTASGNLSLQWAQNTSTAANSNVLPGSSFYVRKISN